MILDPRQEFQESVYARGWSDHMASKQFSAAAMAALSTLALTSTDAENSSAKGLQMEGAKRFLHILMNLTEKGEPKSPPLQSNKLNYTT